MLWFNIRITKTSVFFFLIMESINQSPNQLFAIFKADAFIGKMAVVSLNIKKNTAIRLVVWPAYLMQPNVRKKLPMPARKHEIHIIISVFDFLMWHRGIPYFCCCYLDFTSSPTHKWDVCNYNKCWMRCANWLNG